MDAPTKILIAGDAGGRLDLLFERVATINAKHGPFACLLGVGDFLGPDAAAALAPYADAPPPLPTYFVGPAALPDGVALPPGIEWLGAAGVRSLHGLQVAYAAAGAYGAATAEMRASAAAPGVVGVDLLLTAEWPRGFFRQLADGALPADLLPEADLPEVGSEAVAELSVAMRPRYHFVGTEGQWYQRPPHRQGARCAHVCRLLAMAKVQEDKKQKWLHALSLRPMASMDAVQLAAVPADATDCPYPYAALADAAAAGAGGGGAGAAGAGGKRKREFAKDERSWVSTDCWFCMSSEKFEAHLLASVGEESYVALPKGPLVSSHALVIPVAHKASSLELTDGESAEVEKYVGGLRKCFAAQGEELVLFERFMCNSQLEHFHLQAVALPAAAAAGCRAAFEQHGAQKGIRFELLPAGPTALRDAMPRPEAFFAVTLPSGERLLHRMATNPRKHPLHFGREVLATLLGAPQRADWKNCLPKLTVGGADLATLEGGLADGLKQKFGPYDPVCPPC